MKFYECGTCKKPFSSERKDPQFCTVECGDLWATLAGIDSKREMAKQHQEDARIWQIERDKLQARVKELEEQKRILFEENGRLLTEKESGQWDANCKENARLLKEAEEREKTMKVWIQSEVQAWEQVNKLRKELEELKNGKLEGDEK